jgi:hypothetical protein
MDLERRRWNSANYHNEAIEMADSDVMMLEVLSLARKTGILVLGPSFERGTTVRVCRPAQMPPDRIPNTMNVGCRRRIC